MWDKAFQNKTIWSTSSNAVLGVLRFHSMETEMCFGLLQDVWTTPEGKNSIMSAALNLKSHGNWLKLDMVRCRRCRECVSGRASASSSSSSSMTPDFCCRLRKVCFAAVLSSSITASWAASKGGTKAQSYVIFGPFSYLTNIICKQ